jgi:hypothetical protein
MYKDILSEILVFKTNISCQEELKKIGSILSKEKNITRWTVDLEDVDKVLRIECEHIYPLSVIEILRDAGFTCEELT